MSDIWNILPENIYQKVLEKKLPQKIIQRLDIGSSSKSL